MLVIKRLSTLTFYWGEGGRVCAARGRPLAEQLADLEGDDITSEVKEACENSDKDNNKD